MAVLPMDADDDRGEEGGPEHAGLAAMLPDAGPSRASETTRAA